MSKPVKLLLGAASIWPIVYMGVFVSTFFFSFALPLSGGRGPHGSDPFGWLLVAHVWTMLVIISLLVFYIRDVFRNSALQDDKRALWAIVLFLGAPIAMPLYLP